MRREVVDDDDIALERWHETLFDIRRKVFPVTSPPSRHGAVIPLRRRPATKVIVFQCPYGTWPTSRSPRRQRPLSRNILDRQRLDLNTSRVLYQRTLLSYPAPACPSHVGSFCLAARRLFFEGDLMTLEEALYVPGLRLPAIPRFCIAETTSSSVKCGWSAISVSSSPRAPPTETCSRSVASRRTPRVAKALYPFDRCTGADLEVFRRLTPRSAAFNARNDASGDICRIALGIVRPPNSNQCDRLAPPRALGKSNEFNWPELALVPSAADVLP